MEIVGGQVNRRGFCSQFCYRFAMQPWAAESISLCLSFPFDTAGVVAGVKETERLSNGCPL